MKIKIYFLAFFLFICGFSFAQEPSKDVTITASGSGKTLEEAKQTALRSATEQAFGAFISSKTEIFNDQVVADQMSSVSSGNIKSFEILNQDQLPDGRWGLTLKAIVSVDKLTSFVEAKGVAIEIKGGMFALNIKQQMLVEQGEIKGIGQMVEILHQILQISFDYSISNGIPQSADDENKNWLIPIEVTAKANKNIEICSKYFEKVLENYSLSPVEVIDYDKEKLTYFEIDVNSKERKKTYYFRKKTSIALIQSLVLNWNFYTKLFAVYEGLDTISYNGNGQIFAFSDFSKTSFRSDFEPFTINFPQYSQLVAKYSWKESRSLNQIELIKGFSVKPLGIISIITKGGYLITNQDGHEFVISIFDLFNSDGETLVSNNFIAKSICEETEIFGFNDWKLPSIDQLKLISQNKLIQQGLGNRKGGYWSIDEQSHGPYRAAEPYIFDFSSGSSHETDLRDNNKFYVLCIRKI
jgi:hypothetical protein